MKFYVQHGYSDEAGDAHERTFISDRAQEDCKVLFTIEAETWAEARDKYREEKTA